MLKMLLKFSAKWYHNHNFVVDESFLFLYNYMTLYFQVSTIENFLKNPTLYVLDTVLILLYNLYRKFDWYYFLKTIVALLQNKARLYVLKFYLAQKQMAARLMRILFLILEAGKRQNTLIQLSFEDDK